MANRGRYKYICEDCNEPTWLSARERTSRFKPRCSNCGSPWIVPSKASKGPEKTAEWNEAKNEQKAAIDRKMGKR